MKDRLFGLFQSTLHDFLLLNLTADNVIVLFEKMALQLLLIVGPIFLIAVAVAVLGNYLQIGFLLTGEPLMMKFNKINPIQGAKQLFSMRALVDFLKSVLKMSIIGIVVYTTLVAQKDYILRLAQMPLEEIALFTWSLTLSLGLKIGLILIILAIFDYMYQRYEHGKSIRMSKQDIKDEYKKTEGDPLIKGKIREKQRRMALQRMMQEIPKADVVITNPTHFAVAIKYDAGQMQAPTVIAKGTDYIALKIRQVAKDNGIITMENKPLARALYAQVEIGESIPADMFQAVAEVLAYVYKLKGKAN